MRKLLFLCTLLTTIIDNSFSQSDSSYTLKQCIQYALENSTSLKNAKLDESIAKAKVGEIRAIGLPQIEGKGDFVDNPRLKKSFMPAAFFNSFAPQAPATDSTSPAAPVNDPSLEKNEDFVVLPNTFQLRNALDVSVTGTQIIFNGTYLVGLQAAKTYKELSEKATVQTKIETVEKITKAYYLVLINKSRQQLIDANILRLDSLLKQTQAMYKNGFVEKIDVDRIEVTYQNLVVEKLKFDNMNTLSYALLKYQMGMPVENKIDVQGSIEDLSGELKNINLEESTKAENRIEYSLLETQKRVNILELKRARSEYLPSLVAFGTIGAFRSANDIPTLFKGKYYDYNMWGLSLKVPIFDGFTKSYKSQQAKLSRVKTENSLQDLRNGINLQVQQSSINFKNNIQTMESLKRNMDLSSNVARISKIKYQQGVGSNIEIINAEASYREASTNYYNALYEALVAAIDYQKAVGKIPVD